MFAPGSLLHSIVLIGIALALGVSSLWILIAIFVEGVVWGIILILLIAGSFFWPPITAMLALFLIVLAMRFWQEVKFPFVVIVVALAAVVACYVGPAIGDKRPTENYQQFIWRLYVTQIQPTFQKTSSSIQGAKNKSFSYDDASTKFRDLKELGKRTLDDIQKAGEETIADVQGKMTMPSISGKQEEPPSPALEEHLQLNSGLLDAAEKGDNGRIAAILERGADINTLSASDETPLMRSAAFGRAEAINFLLSKGADASIKNARGLMAIDYAKTNSRTEVIAILKAAMDRETLFDVVRRNHPYRIQTLVKNGADVNARNQANETPLMEAASYGFYEAVDALLLAGADLNAKNNEGLTALDLAHLSQRSAIEDRIRSEEERRSGKKPFKLFKFFTGSS